MLPTRAQLQPRSYADAYGRKRQGPFCVVKHGWDGVLRYWVDQGVWSSDSGLAAVWYNQTIAAAMAYCNGGELHSLVRGAE